MQTSRQLFDGFSLEPPREWENVTEEGSSTFSFSKADGVGALQFSVGLYQRGVDPEVSINDLREMILDFSSKRGLGVGSDLVMREEPTMLIGQSHSTRGRFLRVWYVSDGRNVALATYNCSLEDIGVELKECERIVASFRFEPLST